MKLLDRLVASLTAKAHAQGVREGRRLGHLESQQRRGEMERMLLASQIGRPVIVVPNEWDNPVIGFGDSIMEVGSSQVLVVENYLTMEKVVCGGVRMDFSMQRLEVALALDPYQLWAITAHNSVGHHDFDKPKSGVRWDRHQIIAALHQHGFFNRWQAFDSDAHEIPGLNCQALPTRPSP